MSGAIRFWAAACYGRAMKHEPTIFEEPDAEAASERRADEDVRHGRLIDHRAVKRWLRSWGQSERSARPRLGD